MIIPPALIANADDLGFSAPINKAILSGFEQGIINSTSVMVNMPFFEEATELIHQNPIIKDIGVHINLGEGKPVTNFNQAEYLDENGSWDFGKVNKKINFLSNETKAAFSREIYGQIDRALSGKLSITHVDSHCHLHTLPCFYRLFLDAVQHFKLKIRLAQTYNEGNYVNFYYRKYINSIFKSGGYNYADHFEDAEHFFINKGNLRTNQVTEIMLHPDYDPAGTLSDHFDEKGFGEWIDFLNGDK